MNEVFKSIFLNNWKMEDVIGIDDAHLRPGTLIIGGYMPSETTKNNNQVNRNPSRNNTNVNQGQTNEKNFSGENPAHGVEINPSKQTTNTEIDLDRDGVRTAGSDGSLNYDGGEQNDQDGEETGIDTNGQRLENSRGASGSNAGSQMGPQQQQQQQQQQPQQPTSTNDVAGNFTGSEGSMGGGIDDDELTAAGDADEEEMNDEDVNAAGGNNGGTGVQDNFQQEQQQAQQQSGEPGANVKDEGLKAGSGASYGNGVEVAGNTDEDLDEDEDEEIQVQGAEGEDQADGISGNQTGGQGTLGNRMDQSKTPGQTGSNVQA